MILIDADTKDTLKKLAALLAVLLFFHCAPAAYVWLSSIFFDRNVVIDARRYEFILFVANIICGVGILAGVADIVWHHLKRGKTGRLG
ncbi:MAG TPA: hypothetical protein VF491_13865 [Vicinamibacterales bacterium]